MKVFIILLVFSFAYAAGHKMAIAQNSDLKSAKTSVVKIQARYHVIRNGKTVKELGTATGWCWKEPSLIVTALHAVTGSSDITVFKEGAGSSKATVFKVLKEADLALLRLSTDLGLVPLSLQEANPNSSAEYYVWGFPHSVFSMQGDDIRFSRSLESTPTLNSILTGNKLKSELTEQGYPLPSARIYRISSTIQPGHSGAPIMAKEGSVIGVADGGLREGTARINWAMPASYYVPRLYTSNDILPKEPSVQASLYNNRIVLDMEASEQEEVQELNKEAIDNTVVSGTTSISKTWTASYDEILSSMSDADINDLITITSSFQINMSDTRYDIYEDYATGATIAVPYDKYFTIQNGWFYSSNDNGSIIYNALPFASGTYENAKSNAYYVFQQNFPENKWVYNPESPDKIEVEDNYEWASYEITRVSNDGSGQVLVYRAEVAGPDLLVTFMIYNEDGFENTTYLKHFLYYALCMQMATFVKY